MVKRTLLILSIFIATIFLIVSSAPYFNYFLIQIGVKKESIMIAGTGSMYPTFPKGEGTNDLVRAQEIVAWPQMKKYPSGLSIFGKHLFDYTIQNGDIVEFQNDKTKQLSEKKYGEEAGFVKRVIAQAGDTIDLRDGFVSVNGQLLTEPYIAKARATYGGDYLPDCKQMTIPPGFVFVMGDNRKASLDSRYELGLVSLDDIHYVIPWNQQEEYKKSWRDTTGDFSLAHTTTLDPQKFIELLNAKRLKESRKVYKYQSLLDASAKIRGEAMIKSDDFSPEGTRSGMTLEKAIRQSGYRNIIFAEVYSRGFYEADELLDNLLEFPDTKKILFSDQYQDIGLAAVLGEINGCPVQAVIVHFGGYVPPNYSKEQTDSWQSLVENLEKILPSWEALKQADGVDQGKLTDLVNLLNTRLSNAKRISTKMRANQWLDDEEKKMAENDKNLATEAEKLVAELNKR
ncbi:signal peptidase I [Candidatus Microgenomates bacterium]|nr:signal peptidase I [Candidatus Microgenomates bacterium]